jgi:hypothetical protein
LGVQLVVIQEKVDGLGNFHAPPPVFDSIMLMLIYKGYHNFFRKFDKFLSWQVNQTNLGSISLSSLRSSDGETGPKFD